MDISFEGDVEISIGAKMYHICLYEEIYFKTFFLCFICLKKKIEFFFGKQELLHLKLVIFFPGDFTFKDDILDFRRVHTRVNHDFEP